MIYFFCFTYTHQYLFLGAFIKAMSLISWVGKDDKQHSNKTGFYTEVIKKDVTKMNQPGCMIIYFSENRFM